MFFLKILMLDFISTNIVLLVRRLSHNSGFLKDHKDLPKPFSSGPKSVLMVETFNHYKSTILLIEFIQAGCHLCSLLFPGISDAIAFASSNANPDPVAIPTRVRQLENSQGRLVLRVSYAARNDLGRISLSDGRIGLGNTIPTALKLNMAPVGDLMQSQGRHGR
jgi:hypothetical protein